MSQIKLSICERGQLIYHEIACTGPPLLPLRPSAESLDKFKMKKCILDLGHWGRKNIFCNIFGNVRFTAWFGTSGDFASPRHHKMVV